MDNELLTQHARGLKLSATLEINEFVQKRLDGGKRVIHLGFGEATFPIQKDVLAAHREASQETSYLPVRGLLKLRERVAQLQSRRLGCSISPQQVLIAPGSKPLLFALFDILKGDVLLPRPSWVSYEPQVKHAGKRLFWIETDEEDRHSITESSLKSTYDQAVATGSDPRIMLINSPSNPTGQIFSQANLELIARFCQQRKITLISDEIYSDIHFGENSYASTGAEDRLNAGQMLLTGGLSKTYSAGGWRIGFAIFPATEFGGAVQKTVLAYASECWSAASAPAQEAAAVAFDTNSAMDLYRHQVSLLHQRCTRKLYEALRVCGLAVPEPKGAFYVYPSFHPYTKQLQALGITTSLQLSRWLIEECGVAALPGSAFGEDDDGLPGGRYRLRMATSYLYFRNQQERYTMGYEMLQKISSSGAEVKLPLLDEAIEALQKAVAKVNAVSL